MIKLSSKMISTIVNVQLECIAIYSRYFFDDSHTNIFMYYHFHPVSLHKKKIKVN